MVKQLSETESKQILGVAGDCRVCGQTKDLSEFYKDKSKKSGYSTICKNCGRAKRKAYYESNKEKVLKANKKWLANNPEKRLEQQRRYTKKNKESVNAYARFNSSNYRASKELKTPNWLSEQHRKEIREIYAHARDCEIVSGEKYHVDHIVPLNGESISGLHVPWNLQVLPSDLNIAKSNSYG